MATVLDVSLFQAFDSVFAVLFTIAVVYALLHKLKLLGESPIVNGVVAAVAGFTILFSRDIIEIINFIIPWFAVVIIFGLLLMLVFMMFGVKEGDFFSYMRENQALGWLIFGIGALIIIAGIATTLGQRFTDLAFEDTQTVDDIESDVASTSFQESAIATLVHPRVLGLIVLFIIAILTIALISGTPVR